MSEQRIIDGEARELPRRPRLYRSLSKRSIAGVCGGLSDYLGVDVSLIRALWLLSLLVSFGTTSLLYLLLAVIIPEEPADNTAYQPAPVADLWRHLKQNKTLLWGLGLLVVGIVLLLNNLGLLPVSLGQLWHAFWALFWPLLLIGLGVFLLLNTSATGDGWSRLRHLRANLPIRRSRRDRVIAGVCGGLGAYLGVDPVLIRLLWALGTVATFGIAGVVLYGLVALVLPVEAAE